MTQNIILVIMYGDGQRWLEPVDLTNPPAWFRAEEYTFETYRQESETE